jgi:hypothetical protein
MSPELGHCHVCGKHVVTLGSGCLILCVHGGSVASLSKRSALMIPFFSACKMRKSIQNWLGQRLGECADYMAALEAITPFIKSTPIVNKSCGVSQVVGIVPAVRCALLLPAPGRMAPSARCITCVLSRTYRVPPRLNFVRQSLMC